MQPEIIFKALSDKNRIKILNNLCEKNCPCNVGNIACCCDVDLSVVSRHLTTLKNAGIITSEKKGKEVYYEVNRTEVAAMLRKLADEIESPCCHGKNT